MYVGLGAADVRDATAVLYRRLGMIVVQAGLYVVSLVGVASRDDLLYLST